MFRVHVIFASVIRCSLDILMDDYDETYSNNNDDTTKTNGVDFDGMEWDGVDNDRHGMKPLPTSFSQI